MVEGTTALIVEDEPAAQRRLSRLLSAEGVTVQDVACDGPSAVRMIRSREADVVFLDIEMPDLDGFEVIREVGPREMPPVVFVTAYDRYALDAFGVDAVDYLLKPFGADRVRGALGRLASRRQPPAEPRPDLARALADALDARTYLTRILVREDDAIRFVPVAAVEWIEASGNYVRVHTATDSHLVRRRLGDLEEQLDPSRFLRIHRSTIVNLDAVDRLVPWFSGGYLVRLKRGLDLKLSRGYVARLLERIGTTY